MCSVLPEERNPSESSNVDSLSEMEGSVHQSALTRTRHGGDVISSVGQSLTEHVRHPEEHGPSSKGGFFSHATGLGFQNCTFTRVGGDMISYPIEQLSPWNKYRWVDFNQQSLRHIHTSSTGVVTMEMESSSSCIRVYRIHDYRSREDIFYDHLAFCKSQLARRADIRQFLGTSVENTEGERFIVLAGGGVSLLNLVRDPVDLDIRQKICFFQLMDIFKTGSFAPKNWEWSKFLGLPVFSSNGLLFVDMILLETHGLVTSSQSMDITTEQSRMVHYQAESRHRTCSGDLESVLQCGFDLPAAKGAIKRINEAFHSIWMVDMISWGVSLLLAFIYGLY